MSKSKRIRKWPPIYKAHHRSGQHSFQVDLGIVDGKRKRINFATKAEAETYAEQARIAKSNEGMAAFSLPMDIRQDAAKANQLLAPHGVTLIEAATYYLHHVVAFRNAPTIQEMVDKMLEEAKTNQRRDRTISDLRARLNGFAEDFPNQRLSELTVEDLKEWIDDDQWSARSKINYLTKISQLYNYALKHKWVDSNLADQIDRPTAEDKEPGIFTVEQAKALLSNANQFGLLPYIAIGLFAGLRSAELLRSEASAVNLNDRVIVVSAQVAKKRSRRVVEMCDALVAWLGTCTLGTGQLVDSKSFRDNLDQLREAAGIENWPPNGLRHSFGSYHLAFHGDALKTATIMGHKDPSVLHNHYKALVLKAEAEKYWSLRPEPERDTCYLRNLERSPDHSADLL